MGSSSSKESEMVERPVHTVPTEEDLADFVNMYCELSPKAHVAFNELASALRVFLLSHRGRRINHNAWFTLVDHLIKVHGLSRSGYEADAPGMYRFVFVRGIRLKMFPDMDG